MARRHNDPEGEARTEKLAFLAEASLTELTTQGAGVRQKCNQDRKTSHEAEIKGKKKYPGFFLLVNPTRGII